MKLHIAALTLCLGVCIAAAGCGPRDKHENPAPITPTAKATDTSDTARDTNGPAEKEGAAAFHAKGTVEEVTKPPTPGSVPYKDAVIAVHLANVTSEPQGVSKEIVVYLWGMRDNKTTAASSIERGQTVSVALTPWEDVEDEYGGYNRIELSDPSTLSLQPYWGQLK